MVKEMMGLWKMLQRREVVGALRHMVVWLLGGCGRFQKK